MRSLLKKIVIVLDFCLLVFSGERSEVDRSHYDRYPGHTAGLVHTLPDD